MDDVTKHLFRILVVLCYLVYVARIKQRQQTTTLTRTTEKPTVALVEEIKEVPTIQFETQVLTKPPIAPEPTFSREIHIEALGNMNLPLIEQTRALVLQCVHPDLHQDTWVLSNEAIWRFLVARKMDKQGAKAQMISTLLYRQLRQPDLITSLDVRKEMETGKSALRGPDAFGRPVIVCDSSVENTWDLDGNMKALLFTLNRAIAQMKPPVQKYVIVIRLGETNLRKLPGPMQTKETMKILMTVFAERMGHAILYQPPKVFTWFLSVFKHLLDPHVFEKVVWIRGDVSQGSPNDLLLTRIMGPQWKQFLGEGEPRLSPNIAPGYDPDLEWKRMVREEQERALFCK
jgi:hypothetical protein